MKNAPALGPGQGDKEGSGKASAPIAPLSPRQQPVDPRAALLLRAAARYDLLRHGEVTLDQAFDCAFVDDFLTATNACPCQCAQHQHFDRIARELRDERLRRRSRS